MSFHQQIEDKIVSCGQLTALLDERRKEADGHCKVVFTNGCFDLVHLGHVDYLSRARDLGDMLIVGLNSDDSVRRLKGDSRPISHQNSRAHVLASFAFVDYVVLFDEDTPLRLIQSLRPDILVKGADYTVGQVVGADFVQSYGGDVVLIDLVEGESSTRLVDKMRGKKR